MSVDVYECLKCGERVELDKSLADGTAELKCPKCGDGNLRLIPTLNVAEPSINCST